MSSCDTFDTFIVFHHDQKVGLRLVVRNFVKQERMGFLLPTQRESEMMPCTLSTHSSEIASEVLFLDEREHSFFSDERTSQDHALLLPVAYTASSRNVSARWYLCRGRSLRTVLFILLKILSFIAILGVFLFFVLAHFSTLQEFISKNILKIRHIGIFSPIVFTLVHGLLSSLCIPGEFLTLLGGFLFTNIYGKTVGLPLSFVCSLGGLYICSFLCLFVTRFLLYRTAYAYLRRFQFFSSLLMAISENGAKLVILIRLCPLFPFAITSYFLGLTSLKACPYAIGTLGCIPGVFLLSLAGSSFKSWHEAIEGRKYFSWPYLIVLIVGVFSGIVGVVYIFVRVQQLLRSTQARETGDIEELVIPSS